MLPVDVITASRTRRAIDGRRGFTLLEVTLVLLIMAILVGTASPIYANAMSRYRVEAAARRVAADLAFARQRARATSSERSVKFDPLVETYSLNEESSPGGSGTYVVDLVAPPYESAMVMAAFDDEPRPTRPWHTEREEPTA